MLTNGCKDEAMQPDYPQITTTLIEHDEPPIGDALNHRLVRAMTATLDRLEPEWGRFQGRVYTVASADLPQLPEALAADMPSGWHELNLRDFTPPNGVVHAFSNGDKLFAALIVDPGEADVNPVLILRNDALVEAQGSTDK